MKQLIECRFCDVIIVVCAIRTVLHYCVVITVVCAIHLYAIYSCYSILYESSSYSGLLRKPKLGLQVSKSYMPTQELLVLLKDQI